MNEAEAGTLAWAVRLADERPGRTGVVYAAALLALGVGTFPFHQPLMGLLGASLVLGATAEHWLGSRFRLDAKGASARTGPSVTAMEWSEVKRVLERGREIRLSPLERASFAESTRGVGLLTTPENRDAVLTFVRSHVVAPPNGVRDRRVG